MAAGEEPKVVNNDDTRIMSQDEPKMENGRDEPRMEAGEGPKLRDLYNSETFGEKVNKTLLLGETWYVIF